MISEYVSPLSAEVQEIAEKKLGETEIRRKQCLEQMAQWIKKHPRIHYDGDLGINIEIHI